jgi:hypothetical protein
MTLEEFKEDLNNYMGEGTFDVNLVGNIRIDWRDNNNINHVQVIDPKLLEMKPKDICEEVVRPIVMKFKMYKRRKETK